MADINYDIYSGFYDSVNKDRLYSADDMNRPYKSIVTEGIFDVNDGFAVTPAGGMALTVAGGRALLGERWIDSSEIQITVPANAAMYSRGDTVILQINETTSIRGGRIVYRTGVADGSGEYPGIVIGNDNIHELVLAYVLVGANATAISASNITDKRGSIQCPYCKLIVGDAQIEEAVESVLEDHPEWTTTVQDGAITTAKLASNAVTTAKIADDAVTGAKIADYSIGTDHILNGNVTTLKLADDSVTADKIANKAVAPEHIANGINLYQIQNPSSDSKKIKFATMSHAHNPIIMPAAFDAYTGDALDEMFEEVDTELDTKANVDGYYINLTAGNAEQLISNVYETEQNPYTFRPSGGSLEIGDRETDKLEGMSLPWNQLVKNGNFADTSNWAAVNDATINSVSNNVLNATLATSANSGIVQSSIPFINGHKYFRSVTIKSTQTINVTNAGLAQQSSSGSGAFETLSTVFNWSSTSGNSWYFNIRRVDASDSTATLEVKDCILIDLTQMFGTTIADYIYSLEQSTAGAGVAWFRRYFPKAYYAYNAGEMLHTKFSAHKMVGFNQLDETTGVDGKYINSTNGTEASNSAMWHSDYIRVTPNTDYYTNADGTGYEYPIIAFDADKNFIGRIGNPKPVTFNTGDAHYVIINTNKSLTPIDELVLHFHYDGERDGEYEPYEEYNYPLDSDLVLRGIPKIDAEGNLYADGDTYESDGTVTRNTPLITLDGTESWTVDTNSEAFLYYRFYVRDDSIKRETDYRGKMIGTVPTAEGYSDVYENKGNVLVTAYNAPASTYPDNNWLYLLVNKSLGISTVESLVTYLGSNPIQIVYTAKTPTTETADPFQEIQWVDNWGTEEYVVPTQATDVEVPVGHETQYPVNLRSKTEVQPNAPVADGTYVVKCESGTLTYIPLITPTELPASPSANGTYSLKCTVSDGTATYAWVAE